MGGQHWGQKLSDWGNLHEICGKYSKCLNKEHVFNPMRPGGLGPEFPPHPLNCYCWLLLNKYIHGIKVSWFFPNIKSLSNYDEVETQSFWGCFVVLVVVVNIIVVVLIFVACHIGVSYGKKKSPIGTFWGYPCCCCFSFSSVLPFYFLLIFRSQIGFFFFLLC